MESSFDVLNAPVDSQRGIAALFHWAKAYGFVLNEAHERIAQKHGVDASGVIISRSVPLHRQLPPRLGVG